MQENCLPLAQVSYPDLLAWLQQLHDAGYRLSLHHYLENVRPALLQQLRQSLITHWLRSHNLRQVQYWAGHKHISTTERYCFHQLEALQEKIHRFHPMEKLPPLPEPE